MSHVKTAISIDRELFADAERAAREIHIPRSRLFEMALRDWMKKQSRKKMIEQINAAVRQDHLEAGDKIQAALMRKHQQKLVEGEW